jgi:hypothetical protein
LSSIEDAAIRVVTCLQMMGEQQSNPVLEILDPQQPFHEDQKYPENKLIFNNGEWRAYYHRHAPPYRFENEHGHFHIFHRLNSDKWTHIAALSIDSQGQAQKWFVTNRWVTNEAWQDAGRFREFFSKEPEDKSILLVERWLLAMLMLFQEEIQSLLEQREQQVKKLAKQSSFNEVLEDRRFYILAEMDIQLQDKLAYVLTGLG